MAWRNDAGVLYSHATVLRTEDNLCWIKVDDGGDSVPFIWYFPTDKAMNSMAELLPHD